MSVLVEKYSDTTNCVTHSGVFHADEVLGTVILEKAFGDLQVARVTTVPIGVPDNVIVYDIGNGRFDHHQPGGNGQRDNGIEYASAGLLWKEYGSIVVKGSRNPEYLWRYVDECLIQGVDAADNGNVTSSDEMNRAYTFTKMIAGFNPEWDDARTFDDSFVDAVSFARTVFENVLSRGEALIRARDIVNRAIEATQGAVMVLDAPVPWKEALLSSDDPKASEILFVVYPSERDGFVWQGVPDALGSYGQRKAVPEAWRGLSGRELQSVTGIATAEFCHSKGFAGSARTLEDAVRFAELACE